MEKTDMIDSLAVKLNRQYLSWIEKILEKFCSLNNVKICDLKQFVRIEFHRNKSYHFMDRRLFEIAEIFIDNKKEYVVELALDGVTAYRLLGKEPIKMETMEHGMFIRLIETSDGETDGKA